MHYYDPFLELVEAQRQQINKGILALQQKIEQKKQQKEIKQIHHLHQQLSMQKMGQHLLETKRKEPTIEKQNSCLVTPDFERRYNYDYVERMSTLKKLKENIRNQMLRYKYLPLSLEDQNGQLSQKEKQQEKQFRKEEYQNVFQNIEFQESPKQEKKDMEFSTPYKKLESKEKVKKRKTKREDKKAQKKEKGKKSESEKKKQKEEESKSEHLKSRSKLQNKRISDLYRKYSNKKRKNEVNQASSATIQKIMKRFKLAHVYEDTNFPHEKHEKDHLEMTYEKQMQLRKQIKGRIGFHPSTMKKHGFSQL